ncbi:MAG: hypothetical protein ACRD0Q_04335 [Acidimicrobiales bacterium]
MRSSSIAALHRPVAGRHDQVVEQDLGAVAGEKALDHPREMAEVQRHRPELRRGADRHRYRSVPSRDSTAARVRPRSVSRAQHPHGHRFHGVEGGAHQLPVS